MKQTIPMIMFYIGASIVPGIVLCQEEGPITEEESAEVSFEEYSDEFQESFFEGLKQQGIQNYDKAINAFLKCKNLEPEKDVVSFELAKSYLLNKQYVNAQQYAEEALAEVPTNYWYANTLAETLEAQNLSVSMVKDKIPWDNGDFKKNLAKIYFELGNYQEAKSILEEVKKTAKIAYLQSKIEDSISKKQNRKSIAQESVVVNKSEDANNLSDYEKRIKDAINGSVDLKALLALSEEALESYPSQPFLYYAQGYALRKENKNSEAIESLETALDYIIDDSILENKIYKELSEIYAAMGNTDKATQYLNKVKPGF
ncbi:tetratricopeptide repeat protein [Maribacter cobaltidurans]|uniref:Tetratricopeptide repeat protein n=1 Tax=Maribacter cobaltidurans TaxID=1178778 RepID=A0A223V4T9_9FLAO|nr:tetratricopeptide repeat protein [Maribacter cobaltidurans]ASV30150.1 hypothetical protein CJ263_07885 [Maribacter cobaltidurans]